MRANFIAFDVWIVTPSMHPGHRFARHFALNAILGRDVRQYLKNRLNLFTVEATHGHGKGQGFEGVRVLARNHESDRAAQRVPYSEVGDTIIAKLLINEELVIMYFITHHLRSLTQDAALALTEPKAFLVHAHAVVASFSDPFAKPCIPAYVVTISVN